MDASGRPCSTARSSAAEAGADIIVAQGTEGGGHVGVMATLPLTRMVVRPCAPIPVVAAGGIADGEGIAAALMLGAQGVLLGTRFLATERVPAPRGLQASDPWRAMAMTPS